MNKLLIAFIVSCAAVRCAVAQSSANVGAPAEKQEMLHGDNRVIVKDGVICFFPDGAKDGVVTHCQIEGKKLWVDAVKRGGILRQIRVTSYVGSQGTQTPVKLFCPEVADGTFAWNKDVKREGDTVSVMLGWNGVLIGDFMNVHEGAGDAEKVMKKLGVSSGSDSSLPVVCYTGDSIALCCWPYLEAALTDKVNVYYQLEVGKDIPAANRNAHTAGDAWAFYDAAYKDARFKPKYLLMNFGLHMIATHAGNVAGYGQWIEKMDDVAKQHGAQLIWVTTTPYQQSFRPAQNLTIIKFNDMAKVIATKRNFPVVDLHACTFEAVKELGDAKVYEDGVHFRDEVCKRQADYIAARVSEIAKIAAPAKPFNQTPRLP